MTDFLQKKNKRAIGPGMLTLDYSLWVKFTSLSNFGKASSLPSFIKIGPVG